ncbi:DUF2236 domain-containing protein [Pseudonocardia sp. ICBG1122]|nr:DUF2236 domain-containing protein [Pseudonocardia pini]
MSTSTREPRKPLLQRLARRRWIRARLAMLDPERDTTEIVRLSTLYGAGALQMHWFYAVSTPAAGIAPHVLDAVWREGAGDYNVRPTARKDDSVDHLLQWFEHGADAAATVKSIEIVNNYHARHARRYPTGFDRVEDYTYILCLNATAVDSSVRSLGLPGFDATQRRAAHLFWSRLATRFTLPDGTSVTELERFPDSYDAMLDYVEQYQRRPWPVHEPGHLSTTAAIEHFADTWFPRPLRFFGRALVTSFMSPHVLRAHAIDAPPTALSVVARMSMRVMMLAAERLLPDPEESYPDRRRRLAAAGTAPASAVDVAVHRAITSHDLDSTVQGGPHGCPHLNVLS